MMMVYINSDLRDRDLLDRCLVSTTTRSTAGHEKSYVQATLCSVLDLAQSSPSHPLSLLHVCVWREWEALPWRIHWHLPWRLFREDKKLYERKQSNQKVIRVRETYAVLRD